MSGFSKNQLGEIEKKDFYYDVYTILNQICITIRTICATLGTESSSVNKSERTRIHRIKICFDGVLNIFFVNMNVDHITIHTNIQKKLDWKNHKAIPYTFFIHFPKPACLKICQGFVMINNVQCPEFGSYFLACLHCTSTLSSRY